ncbi:camp-dependent protein kinase 10 [Phycomyces nitens]|nr:camp-dependent protein kinase 10 [Phycomyces nitens]
MPFHLISSIVSSLLRRTPEQQRIEGPKSTRPQSSPSIAFSSTVTVQNLWVKKEEGDTQNVDQGPLSQHQLELKQHWHNQPPVFQSESTAGVDDYDLLETLGTGTFGRVYLAKEKGGRRFYAIKVLKKAEIVRLKQVEHINSERQVLSEVNFPFVVQLYTTFQDDIHLYMVQEYVIGGELFRHLRRAGRFTNEMTRFYTAEIVLAIEYLHSKGIVYRDLKPENLLLDCQGHIKITDFGFAKKVQGRTWTLCGTPEYLAPEIIQSKGHSRAVDWWSLGILIFEMLAGHPPFYDDNHFGIYERILSGKAQYPSYIDSAAKDLIKRLLVGDRNRRLGNLAGGAEDVKRHKWLRHTDWHGLLNKTVRAPLIPAHANECDTSNFEKYPAEQPQDLPKGDPFSHLFTDF